MIHDTNSKYCLRARKPVGKPIRGGGLVTSPGFFRSPILDRVNWWRGSIMIFPQLSPDLRPYIEAARGTALADKMIRSFARPIADEGEVCPTDISAVICTSMKGNLAVFPMVWAFTQSDIENTKRSTPLINCRIETASSKPTWKESFPRRRCVLPASYFFEWQRIKMANGTVKLGQKYIIQPAGSEVTYMAGVYRMEDGYPHFAILTREPEEEYRSIHDRLPVILPRESIAAWVNPQSSPETVQSIAAGAITRAVAEKAM